MSSSIESWVSELQIHQPLENSPNTAAYYANALVTSFLDKLPARSWLGKRMADCAQQDGSDIHTVALANNIWRSLNILDRIRVEIRRQGNPSKVHDVKCRTHKHWVAATEIVDSSMRTLFENNPAMTRSSAVTPRLTVQLCLLFSLRDPTCVRRWSQLIQNIQLEEEGLIDEDVIPPRSTLLSLNKSPEGL